jgi:hypothetical protein
MAVRCPVCGTENSHSARVCSNCGAALPRKSRRGKDEPPPVPQNALALFAWRCANYALVPVAGLLFGPLAFCLGALSYRRNQEDPIVSGNAHATASMLLGGLALVTNWAGAVLIWYGWLSLAGH